MEEQAPWRFRRTSSTSIARAWRSRSAIFAFSAIVAACTIVAGPEQAGAGTTGGISGIATAPDGTRIAHLPLIIMSPATGILTTTTDKQGFFVVLALPPGRYMFLGTHLGLDYFFRADCVGVDVHADQVSQVHIWLDRKWDASSCGDVESALPAGFHFAKASTG